MSVEVKRVQLDFRWPLNVEWSGYLNILAHAAATCPACKGTLMTATAQRLHDLWTGHVPFRPEDRDSIPFVATDEPVRAFAERQFQGRGEKLILHEAHRIAQVWNRSWRYHLNDTDIRALIAADRLHPSLRTDRVPTAREVNLWSIVNWASGHDHRAEWACIEAECQRLGKGSPTCNECNGEGQFWPSEQARAASATWTRTDPPIGDGYQMWETITSGSPISPVYTRPSDLAAYMVNSRYSEGMSTREWTAFIEGPGWSPSWVIMMTPSGAPTVVSGARAMLMG